MERSRRALVVVRSFSPHDFYGARAEGTALLLARQSRIHTHPIRPDFTEGTKGPTKTAILCFHCYLL
jgi:hypothetical protein